MGNDVAQAQIGGDGLRRSPPNARSRLGRGCPQTANGQRVVESPSSAGMRPAPDVIVEVASEARPIFARRRSQVSANCALRPSHQADVLKAHQIAVGLGGARGRRPAISLSISGPLAAPSACSSEEKPTSTD